MRSAVAVVAGARNCIWSLMAPAYRLPFRSAQAKQVRRCTPSPYCKPHSSTVRAVNGVLSKWLRIVPIAIAAFGNG